jgi:hypothetical protein
MVENTHGQGETNGHKPLCLHTSASRHYLSPSSSGTINVHASSSAAAETSLHADRQCEVHTCKQSNALLPWRPQQTQHHVPCERADKLRRTRNSRQRITASVLAVQSPRCLDNFPCNQRGGRGVCWARSVLRLRNARPRGREPFFGG